ncbi:Permease of the drug/metabolite transporter (DMT) superfamily [Paucidesulfovibrio gracilis DSM 16080]|uniref:Permease of the drug/metabolite transporter (DMT) superfamily n=1 Tax=Paucidesulfovibrio gracilis DSM 16080 TaxID=1121449 RepID=A0A1T4XDP5_9BACT|nr:DMT family transporter [Paucidesulfovibrio gracilis]SKA87616.1 Permease of the drug/metabolite transporter (DMT) superfamily [Paucidesulfovibrio gracilis DSM 16080]
MNTSTVKSDLLLLTTALIWGTAFVFQKTGMDHLGPFAFNGIRFVLGSLALTPLTLISLRRSAPVEYKPTPGLTTYLKGGMLAGGALFGGAALQQVGIVTTTAANAGFITGLYVILTPLMGLFFRQRPGWGTWVGGVLAVAGLYLLSVHGSMSISQGDLYVLVGAFFWTAHMLVIGWLAPKMNPIALAQAQFMVCGLLSMAVALPLEEIPLEGILGAADALLYCGLMSTGVAYTLQVVAQQEADPAHASIILSLEAVFAAVAGWFLLSEVLGLREISGCALMLCGMILSQLRP